MSEQDHADLRAAAHEAIHERGFERGPHTFRLAFAEDAGCTPGLPCDICAVPLPEPHLHIHEQRTFLDHVDGIAELAAGADGEHVAEAARHYLAVIERMRRSDWYQSPDTIAVCSEACAQGWAAGHPTRSEVETADELPTLALLATRDPGP